MRYLTLLSVISSFAFAEVTPFSLPQMNASPVGSLYKMADHPNAIFVMESYFLDCSYCNENAPNVDQLVEEYKADPRVQVLDVGVDKDLVQYQEWIERHDPNHPVLNDGKMSLTKQLGTTSYPSTYVVNSKGQILYRTRGVWSASTKTKIRQTINTALGSGPGETVVEFKDTDSVPLATETKQSLTFSVATPGLGRVVVGGTLMNSQSAPDCMMLATQGPGGSLTSSETTSLVREIQVNEGIDATHLLEPRNMGGTQVYYLKDLGQSTTQLRLSTTSSSFQALVERVLGSNHRNFQFIFSRGCKMLKS